MTPSNITDLYDAFSPNPRTKTHGDVTQTQQLLDFFQRLHDLHPMIVIGQNHTSKLKAVMHQQNLLRAEQTHPRISKLRQPDESHSITPQPPQNKPPSTTPHAAMSIMNPDAKHTFCVRFKMRHYRTTHYIPKNIYKILEGSYY